MLIFQKRSAQIEVPDAPDTSYSLMFLLVGFILAVVRERASGARRLQFLSGGGYIPFWVSRFLIDYLLYIFVCFIMVVLCIVAKVDALAGSRSWKLLLIMSMYGWSGLTFLYFFSNGFKVPASGYTAYIVMLLIIGKTYRRLTCVVSSSHAKQDSTIRVIPLPMISTVKPS